MCGVVGLLTLDGRPADGAIARAMARAIAHRGPDGEGVWQEGAVALAHRRLAIRDLSAAAAQPFHSACGRVVVVYNGELYNDRPLRAELERQHGLISRTTCDTEIIPAGYLAWGMELFDRIRGIFAIALWDRERQRLVLARDGVGVKPLYVQHDDATLRFGSETKALLADHGWRTGVRAERMHALLTHGHLGPADSLLLGVEQVPPGCVRAIDRDSDRTTAFWKPSRSPGAMSARDAVDALVTLLPKVVEDQLVSDVPVGVLQSAGIDSTLVALSLPSAAETRLFTVRFAEKSHDEAPLAAAVAAKAGRPHVMVDLPDTANAEATFRSVAHHLDGELADSSAFAAFRLAEQVRRHVKVALSGDGGDEVFAGYPTYRATQLAQTFGPLLRLLPMRGIGLASRRLAGVSQGRITPVEMMMRFCLGCTAAVPHATWRRYLDPADAEILYGPGLSALLTTEEGIPPDGYADAWRQAAGGVIDRSLVADQCYYLPADMLTKVDRTSMAHGLEVRVPLLDRRVTELAASVPSEVLYPALGLAKAVPRAAARRLGAPDQLARAPKRGFNVPVNQLLAGPLRPLADQLCRSEADVFHPFLRPDAVRQFWAEHRSGRIDRGYLIWALLTLAVRRDQLGSRLSYA